MKLEIFQLRFSAPLHLSDVRADYGKSERIIRSDSLTAAVMQAWSVLGKDEWISQNPGFVVSSLFPFISENDSPVYFLPKPYTQLNVPGEFRDPTIAKKVKKVAYYDLDYFNKALLREEVEPAEHSYKGEFLTDKKIDKNFLLADVRVRIRRPRNEEDDAEPFYMEQLRFKNGAGLWGMVIFDNELSRRRFTIALNYLQEAGLGTDRNVGNGQFTLHWDIQTQLPFGTRQSEYGISLSLFCPENEAQLESMLDDNSRYEIVKRGGWISEPYNTYRKQSVWMFKEGSVFKMPDSQNVLGKIVDLRPEVITENRPVWRSGRAIFLPINWKG